jgi:hypothetical protein
MRLRTLTVCCCFISCSSSRMTETQLYFGLFKPNGSLITEQEWTNFSETQIPKVFKEGSTTVNTVGKWLDPVTHKLITESGRMVIYHHKTSALISKRIDTLIALYKTMFDQQSVLGVDKKVKAHFR